MMCFDTMIVQRHSSSKLMLRSDDSGLHCCKPMPPSHSPVSHWLIQKVATPRLNAKYWESCLDLSDSTNTSMDGTWKCIRTIHRLSPYTPNISSWSHPGSHVCYSAYNSTAWTSSTFLAVTSNWQMHSPGWIHVTRGLSEVLTCLCTKCTCIWTRAQLYCGNSHGHIERQHSACAMWDNITRLARDQSTFPGAFDALLEFSCRTEYWRWAETERSAHYLAKVPTPSSTSTYPLCTPRCWKRQASC